MAAPVKCLRHLSDVGLLEGNVFVEKTLRKFAPALIETPQFRATRTDDPMLAALKLMAGLNQPDDEANQGRTQTPILGMNRRYISILVPNSTTCGEGMRK